MSANRDVIEHLRQRLPGLADSDLLDLAQKVSAELEERVGEILSTGLTDAQLEEFEVITDSGDDEGAVRWLQANRPNFQQVATQTLLSLIDEVVAAVSETIQKEEGSAPPAEKNGRLNDVSDTGSSIRNWDELLDVLHSIFSCRLNREKTLSLIFDLPEDRSQLVLVSHVNDHWAEVHSAVGNALGPDQLATALTSLGSYIGVGGVLRDELLIARHGLPYRGLTVEAVERTVGLVAVAADTAEKDATGENIY